jgi:hypothetical protein
MSTKRQHAPTQDRTPQHDDPHLRAKSQMEQHMKKVLHRPAARLGEMRPGKGR